MKLPYRLLIAIVLFLLASVIIFSVKIVDYPSLGNLLVSKIGGKPVCKDCNVILISLDTLSANHLPCYGYARNTAPNLCKFGKENTLFTNMFSNANYTLPSHVSIFTGLYPNKHKVDREYEDRLSLKIPFLPEMLQKNGYKTLFYMILTATHLPIDKVYNRGINQLVEGDNPPDWKGGLEALSQNNSKGKKTFLFLHTYWVHEPYVLEKKERQLYVKKLDSDIYPKTWEEVNNCTPAFLRFLKEALKNDLLGGKFNGDENIYSIHLDIYEQLSALFDGKNELRFCNLYKENWYLYSYYSGYIHSKSSTADSKTINYIVDLYDSKIVELDEYLKDVFAYVQNSDLKKNTIIIVTTDHGEEFMEHGALGHGINLYDTSLKVPLMMYIPGQKKREISQFAQSVDIVPTLLGLLKLKNPYKLSGVDLFINNIFNASRYAVAQHNIYNDSTNIAVIRDSEWKLFYKFKDNKPVAIRLFNYKKDPQEKNNVMFKQNAVVSRLLKNVPK